MVSVPRRALGVVLLALAALLLAQPFVLRSTGTMADGWSTGSGTLAGVVLPALVAAGVVVLVAGVAALAGRRLAPRWSLAAPAVSGIVAVAVGVDLPTEALSAPAIAMAGSTPLVVAGAVVGASLAPVTLGATKGDTVTLLAGVVALFAALFAAPAPALALVSGLLGGGVAVGLLWGIDGDTWRP